MILPKPIPYSRPKPAPRNGNAFIKCVACDGMGFVAKGDFASRTFHRCPTCNGIGQEYVKRKFD